MKGPHLAQYKQHRYDRMGVPTMVDKKLHNIAVPVGGRCNQGALAIDIGEIQLAARIKEHLHHCGVVV